MPRLTKFDEYRDRSSDSYVLEKADDLREPPFVDWSLEFDDDAEDACGPVLRGAERVRCVLDGEPVGDQHVRQFRVRGEHVGRFGELTPPVVAAVTE